MLIAVCTKELNHPYLSKSALTPRKYREVRNIFHKHKRNRRQQLDGEKVDSLPSKPNNQAILTDLRQGASEDQKFDCQGLHSVKKREI